MSYYYQHHFSFSYHGLTRIKQRLNMAKIDDYEAKDRLIEMIDNSSERIETRYHFYIYLDDFRVYVVVDKRSRLIITVTPISASKMIDLLQREDDDG